jgi:hypothetical protein
MDIIDLTIKNGKFYSPATGEIIYDSIENYVNSEEKSLSAYWDCDTDNYWDHYHEHYEPETGRIYYSFPSSSIKNAELYSGWKYHLHYCSHIGERPGEMGKVDLENFIFDYRDPNLICFRITNPDKHWDKMYFVIEMNGKVESPE